MKRNFLGFTFSFLSRNGFMDGSLITLLKVISSAAKSVHRLAIGELDVVVMSS